MYLCGLEDLVVYFGSPMMRPGCVLLETPTRPGYALLKIFCTSVRTYALFSAGVERSGTKAENSGGSRSPCSLLTLHRLLKPITLAGEYHYAGVMHQAVYQSGCQSVIAQHRIPTGEL